jgi:two-component system OmpR family sensor kinase
MMRAAAAVRGWLRGWPLRRRLVALLMALVAVGLLVAGIAAAAALRGYLYREVDRGLAEVAGRLVEVGPVPPAPGGAPDGDYRPERPGPVGQERTYVRFLDATGAEPATTGDSPAVTDPPDLPDPTVDEAAALGVEPYVVDSVSGGTRWRALTVPLDDGSGSVTVALDIGGIDATVNRLVLIELVVGALIVAGLGMAGSVLVRRSLRPLTDVERAAATIAAGDLSHRAPAADPRTEVGSLAASFNTMVDSLQRAFAAQQASERAARVSAVAAQASEARMRQFIADASHELRTPLTSVRGFAELYRIGAVPPGQPLADTMARIEGEAARMGVLVEDLLLLARLDQQRPLEQSEVDLLALATDAVVSARAAAPGREVRVDAEPGSPPPVVVGDRLRLRQVVDNLLSNALRYSPGEEPVLVRVGVVAAEGRGWAQVEVVDRGPGLAPEEAARVFERFYRADPARSRAHGGTGLGLAIVAAIVGTHGGRVDVATEIGQGATFRVRIPLAADAPDPAPGTSGPLTRAAARE